MKKIKHPLYLGYIYDRDGIAYLGLSYKGKRYRESSKLAFNQANKVRLMELLEVKVMDIITKHEGTNIYSLHELFNKYLGEEKWNTIINQIKLYQLNNKAVTESYSNLDLANRIVLQLYQIRQKYGYSQQ